MTYEVIVPQGGDVKGMQNESTASQMKLNRDASKRLLKLYSF